MSSKKTDLAEISGVEEPVIEFAKRHGWLERKMKYVNRRNCPDRWFFKAGRLVIVEFKKPGEKPSIGQKREHARLRRQGFEVHVIDKAEDGYALLAE